MDLSNVVCIREILHNEKKANEYLKLGWKLLEICKQYDGPDERSNSPVYIIGWLDKDHEPAKTPEEIETEKRMKRLLEQSNFD